MMGQTFFFITRNMRPFPIYILNQNFKFIVCLYATMSMDQSTTEKVINEAQFCVRMPSGRSGGCKRQEDGS